MVWTYLRRAGYLVTTGAGLAAAALAGLDRSSHWVLALLGVGLAALGVATMASLRSVQRSTTSTRRTAARSARTTQKSLTLLTDGLDVLGRTTAHRLDGLDQAVAEIPWLLQDLRASTGNLTDDIPSLVEAARQNAETLREVDALVPTLRTGADFSEKTYRRSFTLSTGFEESPSQLLELERLHHQLVVTDRPMPPLGGWAATVSTISLLTDTILHTPSCRTIVECGSGSSTVWSALALDKRGTGGHVYSLDHELKYGGQTREHLANHHVTAHADVIIAGLVPTAAEQDEYLWYDLSGLSAVESIDLLFVDGPPSTTGDNARFPAYPLLASKLSDGALVVLDDTDRAEERDIVEAWIALEVPGRSLRVRRIVGRATVLEVTHTS